MIEILLDDGVTKVYVSRVDHVTTAESAAQALWTTLYRNAKVHGGSAFVFSPEDRDKPGWAACWSGGPKQWADAYVVSEGADSREFASHAERGDTVVFMDLD